MTHRPHWAVRAFAFGVALLLVLPLLLVIPMSFSDGNLLRFPPEGFSFRWYDNFFSDRDWTDAAMTSLKVGLASAALATVLGTLAAMGLVRGSFPGRGVLTAIMLSPLMVPLVVVAIGVYFVFVRLHIAGSYTGLILAHTSLAMPFVIVNVAASLRNFDTRLELAAQSLGAGRVRTFARVTLPLILPGVSVGALFAFLTSWDEVVVSIFLSSPLIRPLPVVMWTQVRTQIDPTIAAVATMLTALTVLMLLAVLLVQTLGSRRLARQRGRT
jgi:putative spermidine/putrescine transport system permease protein